MQTGSTHLQSSESSLQQPHKVTFPDSSHFKNCWTKPICQVQMQWNVNLRRAMKRGSKQAASRRENTQFYPNTPGPVVHTYNFVQVAHNWVCLVWKGIAMFNAKRQQGIRLKTERESPVNLCNCADGGWEGKNLCSGREGKIGQKSLCTQLHETHATSSIGFNAMLLQSHSYH